MAPDMTPMEERRTARPLRVAVLVVVPVVLVVVIAVAAVRIRAHTARTAPSIPTVAPFSNGRGAAAAVDQAQNWTQYHADDSHTGSVNTPALLPATAAWTSPALDGDVYGEPAVRRRSDPRGDDQ